MRLQGSVRKRTIGCLSKVGLLFLMSSFLVPAPAKELDQLVPKPSNAGDWRRFDREALVNSRTQSKLIPDAGFAREGSEFFSAWRYNVQHNAPDEYATVAERHAFYEVLSILLTTSKEAVFPSALRCVKFFDAAADVTDRHQVGVVEMWDIERRILVKAGALPELTADDDEFLLAVNKVLFRANFDVVRKLLTEWKEPRDPNSANGSSLTAFAFDLQMVEFEQSRVQSEIDSYIKSGDSPAAKRFKQLFQKHLAISEWAAYAMVGLSAHDFVTGNQAQSSWLPAIGITDFDFTRKADRVALGQANIFRQHKLSIDAFKAWYTTHTLPTSGCKWMSPIKATQGDDPPNAGDARIAAAVGALGRDPTGLSVATLAAASKALSDTSINADRVQQVTHDSEQILSRLLGAQTAGARFDVLSSDEAKRLNLARYLGFTMPVLDDVGGRPQDLFEERFNALKQLTSTLKTGSDTAVWKLVETATGVGQNTNIGYLKSLPMSDQAGSISKAVSFVLSNPSPNDLKEEMRALLAQGVKEATAQIDEKRLAIGYITEASSRAVPSTPGGAFDTLNSVSALASLIPDPEVQKFAKQAGDAAATVKLIDLAIDAATTGGLTSVLALMSGGGGIAASGLVSSALGGGADGNAATLEALDALKQLMLQQFAIVNVKLDRLLEKVDTLQQSVDQIISTLAEMKLQSTRIERRIDQLSAQIDRNGKKIAELIAKKGASACNEQVGRNDTTFSPNLYADCTSQFVDYVSLSLDDLVVSCPTPVDDIRKALAAHGDVLNAGQQWSYSDLSCSIIAAVDQAMNRAPQEAKLPSFSLLTTGVAQLQALRDRSPTLWSGASERTRTTLRQIVSNTKSYGDVQTRQLGTNTKDQTVALSKLYPALFNGPMGALDSEVRQVRKTFEDSWQAEFVRESISWLGDTRLSGPQTENSERQNYLPAFHLRNNGPMIKYCDDGGPADVPNYLKLMVLLEHSDRRAPWKAPLMLIRSIEDQDLGKPEPTAGHSFAMIDRHVCYRLRDYSVTPLSASSFEWKFQFEFELDRKDVFYVSRGYTFSGTGFDDVDAFKRGLIREYTLAFRDAAQPALENGTTLLVALANSLLSAKNKTASPIDNVVTNYWDHFYGTTFNEAAKRLSPLIQEVDLSRRILRSYLALIVPESLRRSDALRTFLEYGTRRSIASNETLHNFLTGDVVRACGTTIYWSRDAQISDMHKNCNDSWNQIVGALPVFEKQQWRYHFDLFRSITALESLLGEIKHTEPAVPSAAAIGSH